MKKIILITALLACMVSVSSAIDREGYARRQRERECPVKVPDGGSTALMLGAGMLALGIAKRKNS